MNQFTCINYSQSGSSSTIPSIVSLPSRTLKQSKIFAILRKKSRLTPNAWNYDVICILSCVTADHVSLSRKQLCF